MIADADTWIPIVVAMITGFFALAVVVVQTVRVAGRRGLDQNTSEHGETKALIGSLIDGQGHFKELLHGLSEGQERIEGKVDAHILWHAHGTVPPTQKRHLTLVDQLSEETP